MIRSGVVTFLFVCFAIATWSQNQVSVPAYNDLFLQDEVAVVRIIIDEDSLNTLLEQENWFENHEYPAQFIYTTSFSSDTVNNVGFRLRGNTSRNADKKSFKVSINSFIPGQKFLGVEKLNLNGEQNDVSMIRSRLNWKMIHHQEMLGSRSSSVKLYINDEYKGLYHNVEHVDEEFIEKRFPSSDGQLYKCHFGADLDYLGQNPDLYKESPWGQRTYELKTNEIQDDYAPLAKFIDVLNNTPINDLPCELEQVLNVEAFLKTAAYEILIGHWDGYLFNQNNYYLYYHPVEQRFYYISYDLDNTLGIDWVGINSATRPIYQWSNGNRPLYDRLMQVPKYKDRFTYYLNQHIQELVENGFMMDQANGIHSLITPDALEDTYRPLDFGYSEDDFLNALNSAWGEH
ncbi:MAG: CotH kinase family protein, partial [Flavobacteriales bacterium]|nr:CotH kinase family protein [Flavobacteriales bacterium]